MLPLVAPCISLALAVAPHAAGVSALAARRAGSDGVLIVSGGDDAALATITFRRSSARVEVIHLDGCAPVRGLAFTRAGRIVAARGDGVVSAWRVAEDLNFESGWLRATATTSTTLELLSTVDVVLGDVRGCCATDDGALIYGDDGAATVVLC